MSMILRKSFYIVSLAYTLSVINGDATKPVLWILETSLCCGKRSEMTFQESTREIAGIEVRIEATL